MKDYKNQVYKAIYFSRSAIPHIRGIDEKDWYKQNTYYGHVGIYGYRADILLNWFKFGKSNLENCEKLEQLRALDNGMSIRATVTNYDSHSVDTQDDLDKVARIMELSGVVSGRVNQNEKVQRY